MSNDIVDAEDVYTYKYREAEAIMKLNWNKDRLYLEFRVYDVKTNWISLNKHEISDLIEHIFELSNLMSGEESKKKPIKIPNLLPDVDTGETD